MSEFTAKLQKQKASLDAMKTAQSKAEATKESLDKQMAQVDAECRELGVEPKNLEAKILELETSIKKGIDKVDGMIPERFKVK